MTNYILNLDLVLKSSYLLQVMSDVICLYFGSCTAEKHQSTPARFPYKFLWYLFKHFFKFLNNELLWCSKLKRFAYFFMNFMKRTSCLEAKMLIMCVEYVKLYMCLSYAIIGTKFISTHCNFHIPFARTPHRKFFSTIGLI